MSTSINFSKKTIALITGASKGIGRAIAVELSRRLNQNSIIILISRSERGLEETKAEIEEIDKSLTVFCKTFDLSRPDEFEFNKIFQEITNTIDKSDIEFGVIFHNAGYVGALKQTTDLTDLKEWREYFDLNLFSPAILNSCFIKNLRPLAPQLVVVNITSLCGRKPFVNLSMYGSGKASRDLFFKVLSIEEPNVVVLNYSPGVVNTDMFNQIIVEAQSEVLKNDFKEMKTNTLSPVQTVCKMLDLMEKGGFKSGDIVDYFDIE